VIRTEGGFQNGQRAAIASLGFGEAAGVLAQDAQAVESAQASLTVSLSNGFLLFNITRLDAAIDLELCFVVIYSKTTSSHLRLDFKPRTCAGLWLNLRPLALSGS
jgi:hypothetical protein